MIRTLAAISIFLAFPVDSFAQTPPHHGHSHTPKVQTAPGQPHQPAPYAGLDRREVKSLSEQGLTDLRAGKGMGVALPAELQGYPGPTHVLELADKLNLTPDQRARIAQLHREMRSEAIKAGEILISTEHAVDQFFASGSVGETALLTVTRQAAEARAQVRFAHLRFHLSTKAVLSAEQLAIYGKARGYGAL